MSLPLVFGVLNVTPDSFSDGGRWADPDRAVARGIELAAQGADVVDVGGESTRPGASPVATEEEVARVEPVVARLAERGIRVSIDTRHAEVAAAALAAGAAIVNDVDGGTSAAMLEVVAASSAGYVLMHSRGPAAAVGGYGDVVEEVAEDLRDRVAAARAAGISDERLVIDPGIGFAKDADENWRLLADLDRLRIDGLRMLVGVSRKRFLAPFAAEGAPPEQRDAATSVLSALLAEREVWAVRVHDVPATRIALALSARMRGAA